MNKKDKILIVVTVILLLALVFGFIWDSDKLLLNRTLDNELTSDMEVMSMNKYGTLFYRSAYEARIRVPNQYIDEHLNKLVAFYGVEPEMYRDEKYKSFAQETFRSEILKPNPLPGGDVAVIKAHTEDGSYVTYMFDVETENDGFIYIYFSRG